jgi:hypothetical protein
VSSSVRFYRKVRQAQEWSRYEYMQGQDLLSSPNRPDRLWWGPHSLILCGLKVRVKPSRNKSWGGGGVMLGFPPYFDIRHK